jgi:hypothetical protein
LARPEALCVYCRVQPADTAWRPFCSERCKLADLGRWLSEGYRVPEEAPRDEPSAEPPKEDV